MWALLAVMATSSCAADVGPESAPPEAVAPSPQALEEEPSWSVTGSMSVARYNATATRLLDNRVLVAGGSTFGAVDAGSVYFESAELFDPTTQTFSPVPSAMNAKRWQHAAVRLAGRKVLVVGGVLSPSTADIFDPKSKTSPWTATPNLAHERWAATLTLLPSGHALLAGGNVDEPPVGAELYNPTLDTWSETAPMIPPRRNHTATLLKNGRVLVAGGQLHDDGITSSAKLFNPATGAWSTAAQLLIARARHTASLLDDGTVLVVGGSTPMGITAEVELYDPVTNKWTKMPPLEGARTIHSATLLDSGAVLVAGGLDATFSALRTSELFDPKTARWVRSGMLGHARLNHMAETLADGALLVTGGDSQSTAEIYRPVGDGQLCEVGPQCASHHCVDRVCCNEACTARCVTCARSGAEGTCSPAAPGTDLHHDCGKGGPCDDVCDATSACVSRVGEACAPTTCSADHTKVNKATICAAIADACEQPPKSCAPYLCDDRDPATAGCVTHCGSIVDCADGYACDPEGKCRTRPDVAATDAATCEASPRPPGSPRTVAAWLAALGLLAAARRRRRRRHLPRSIPVAAAALAGAMTWSHTSSADEPPPPPPDLVTKPLVSTTTSSMSTVRWLHIAARLPYGHVLAAAGFHNDSVVSTAEFYDPITRAWSPTGKMLYVHDWPIAATLCDGRIFVAGRTDASAREAEIYDPVSKTWSDAGKMKGSHIYGTATLLQDCRLLLTGGYNSNTQAEIYYPDPDKKYFKWVGVMNDERFFHTATRLANNSVLVAGGGVNYTPPNKMYKEWATYATVDIFHPESGLWTKAAKMHQARRAHTATLLPDGRVLVAGGSIGGKNDGTDAGKQLDTAEIYDPIADTWEKVPSKLVTARTFHTAALVANGAVLLFGGLDASGSASRQVEGYFGGTWQALDPLLIDRYQHASALLDDGGVLLTGGIYQATAEVYRLAPNGEACVSHLACASGHCIDKICCNEDCGTGCRSCAVHDKEGTCSPRCKDEMTAWACPDGSDTCANNACIEQPCGELLCNADTAVCRTQCTSVADCAPGYACSLEGACVTPPDVSSGDPGACSAAAMEQRWGAGLGAGAIAAAITLLRRRKRRSR